MGELLIRYRMVLRKMASDTVTVDAVEGDHIVVLYRGKQRRAVSSNSAFMVGVVSGRVNTGAKE